jgi:hypothetical protein
LAGKSFSLGQFGTKLAPSGIRTCDLEATKPLICHCTTEASLRAKKFSNQVILRKKISPEFPGEIWINPDLSGEIPTLLVTFLLGAMTPRSWRKRLFFDQTWISLVEKWPFPPTFRIRYLWCVYHYKTIFPFMNFFFSVKTRFTRESSFEIKGMSQNFFVLYEI